MEALGGYPAKSSSPKARTLRVVVSMTVGVGCLLLLQTQLNPRKPADFYAFAVRDAKGRPVSLEKYRGKVSPRPPVCGENGCKLFVFGFFFLGRARCASFGGGRALTPPPPSSRLPPFF